MGRDVIINTDPGSSSLTWAHMGEFHIEEEAVEFSLVSVQDGVVSWRFKALESRWPLGMITSPSDQRLFTDIEHPAHVVIGRFTVRARVFGAGPVTVCRCRLNSGPSTSLYKSSRGWEAVCEAPPGQFMLVVEATDASGNTDADTIVVAVPGYLPPGTRSGPNRNGRQW